MSAHVEAHPPTPGDEDRYSAGLRGALVARIETLGAPIIALNANTQMDRDQRMTTMITEFSVIWSGVRVCDACYDFEPLPSPFKWIN